jgi:hypothetical protein
VSYRATELQFTSSSTYRLASVSDLGSAQLINLELWRKVNIKEIWVDTDWLGRAAALVTSE